MNERITKPETQAPAPVADVPGQPYTQARDTQGRPMPGRETERFARRAEPLTRTEKLLVTIFVTMFATLVAAGALGFTTLSGQLVNMQEQIGDLQQETSAQLLGMQKQIGDLQQETSAQLLGMQRQIGELSERIARVEERLTGIESFIRTHHGPPAGP